MKEIVPKPKKPMGRPRTGKVKIMITIDPELKNSLDRFCQINRVTRSGFIEALIRGNLSK